MLLSNLLTNPTLAAISMNMPGSTDHSSLSLGEKALAMDYGTTVN